MSRFRHLPTRTADARWHWIGRNVIIPFEIDNPVELLLTLLNGQASGRGGQEGMSGQSEPNEWEIVPKKSETVLWSLVHCAPIYFPFFLDSRTN